MFTGIRTLNVSSVLRAMPSLTALTTAVKSEFKEEPQAQEKVFQYSSLPFELRTIILNYLLTLGDVRPFPNPYINLLLWKIPNYVKDAQAMISQGPEHFCQETLCRFNQTIFNNLPYLDLSHLSFTIKGSRSNIQNQT